MNGQRSNNSVIFSCIKTKMIIMMLIMILLREVTPENKMHSPIMDNKEAIFGDSMINLLSSRCWSLSGWGWEYGGTLVLRYVIGFRSSMMY